MQIDELYYRPKLTPAITKAAEKHYSNPEYNQPFIKKLKSLGWLRMGEGSFSNVFVHPKKNYVLKVNKRPDQAFEHYASIIKKFVNPHFPRISDKKKYEYNDEEYYIYLIEELEHINDTPDINVDQIARDLEQIIRSPDQSLTNIFFLHDIPEYLLESPLLVKAARICGRYITGHMNDMHAENIMKRKDGTIVITDPYAY